MLTLFTVPKPFVGLTAIHQTNALRSWARLLPPSQILVFGDEAGIAEACATHGLSHVPEVERTEHGTPLLSGVFAAAHTRTNGGILGYVNADILLFDDFARAVEVVARARRTFLLVGRRTDVDVPEALCFDAQSLGEFRRKVRSEGFLRDGWWIDYFVFPRGLWTQIPPFVVGRPAWDSWMVHDALRRGVPVVDATGAVIAVHQRHDYRHVPRGRGDHWHGPEGDRNAALAGGADCSRSIEDTTHTIKGGRVVRRWTIQPLRRTWSRWERQPGLAGWAATRGRRMLRLLVPYSRRETHQP